MSSIRATVIRYVTSAYVQRIDIANLDIPTARRRWNRLAGMLMTAIGVNVEPGAVGSLV